VAAFEAANHVSFDTKSTFLHFVHLKLRIMCRTAHQKAVLISSSFFDRAEGVPGGTYWPAGTVLRDLFINLLLTSYTYSTRSVKGKN